MAKKTVPAWQQVLLVALNNVPGAKNGRDAWEKLNDGEKAAVMDYLTEHCGEEAQVKLDEVCGKVKHGKGWRTTVSLLIVLAMLAVVLWAMLWLEKYVEGVHRYLWIVLCPLNMLMAWQGDPAGKAQQIWKERAETDKGTVLALKEMYRVYTAPRKERMNKVMFGLWLVMWLLWIGLVLWK